MLRPRDMLQMCPALAGPATAGSCACGSDSQSDFSHRCRPLLARLHTHQQRMCVQMCAQQHGHYASPMAFPVAETSVLSGASVSQLHNWRRTGLLVPEVDSSGRPLLYSFRDILALRSVVKLRGQNSLQKIRRAFSNMPDQDLTEHPAAYTLVDTGHSILVRKQDGEAVDVLTHPGQKVLATLSDIMAPFETERGAKVVDLRHPRQHLEVREQRLGGWPTIEGTRVPFDIVAQLLADGSITPEEVPEFYPSVSAAAAFDALDFARSLPNWADAERSA